MYASNSSPGPVHFVHTVITRHGRDGTPKYSLVGRQTDMSTNFLKFISFILTKYSMSTRTRVRRKDNILVPSRYDLPALLGSNQPNKKSSPSYIIKRTIVGSYVEDLSKTPGPGQYDAVQTAFTLANPSTPWKDDPGSLEIGPPNLGLVITNLKQFTSTKARHQSTLSEFNTQNT